MIAELALALALQSRPQLPCQDITVVQRIVACTAKAFGVMPRRAIRVAACESSLDPRAFNGTHAGLFQHALKYWGRRWREMGRGYGVPNDPFDPLANSIVTMQMVRESGWSAWSCKG